MATLAVKKLNLGLDAATNVYAGLDMATGGTNWTAASAGGDDFVAGNMNRTFIAVLNAGAAIYFNVGAGKKCDQGHNHDIGNKTATASGTAAGGVAVVATTGLTLLGPFERDEVVGSNGKVSIGYSGVTSVKVAVIELAAQGR